MPAKTIASPKRSRTAANRAKAPEVTVRRITHADANAALKEGLGDFLALRGDILFAALLYPLIGIGAAVVMTGGPLVPLLFPILAGVGLLGPVAAIGFYELARRREQGETSNWSHFLDVRKRPSAGEIGTVTALLLGIFALWLLAAGLLYVALFGLWEPPSIAAFLTRVFTTAEGWALIVIGNLIGLAFAALVLAVSVVSLPLLVDRHVSARTAVETSVRAARENSGVMVRWGLIVAAMLIVGSLPLFLGLAVVLPWLGYATWHLYTRLVDRSAPPVRATRRRANK